MLRTRKHMILASAIVVLLVVIDQVSKIIVANFFMYDRFVFVENVLWFYPILNPNFAYPIERLLAWFSIDASNVVVTTPLKTIQAIVAFAAIVFVYRYFLYVSKKYKTLICIFAILSISGTTSSWLDTAFWGGSLDFIGLFNWFIFDIKDAYLIVAVAFLCLWIILYYVGYFKLSKEERKRFKKETSLLRWIKNKCPIIREEFQMSLPVALQIYSVRDDFAKDMTGTLKKVKALGYDGVELAGFFGNTPAEVKAALDDAGLKCFSSHVPYDEIAKDPDATFAAYKSVGCDYVAIPWLDMDKAPGGKDFAEIMPNIRKFGEIAKKHGITLLYHNHDFEFRKIGDEYGLDVLYNQVPAEYLETQIDTCWVKFVGIDPAEYLRKYKGRAPLVHIKDFVKGADATGTPYELIGKEEEKAEEKAFMFKPVGHGCQDVPSILAAATEVGAKWVIVEYDQSPEHPALETAKFSREYLKSLGW